jgi:hypothetical protein
MDFISIDTAGEIDAAWLNNGMADGGLRLVHYIHTSELTVPSLNDSAPTYQFRWHDPATGVFGPGYYHLSGPTLAEWHAEQDAAEASRDAADLYAWASGR